MGDDLPPSNGPNGTFVNVHRLALPVLSSLLLHAGLVVGVPLPERPALPDPGELEAGDEGDDDAETLVPVRVHVEADPFTLADVALPTAIGAGGGEAVRVEPIREEEEKPAPPPEKKRRKAVVKPPPEEAPPVAATEDAGLLPETEPVAEAEPEPPPASEPPEAEAKTKKLARRAGSRAARPPRNQKACDTSDDIVAMEEPDTWWIERDIVEYYASHMKELQKLGAVWTHKTDGKPDGFKVGLSRCSLLKQGGLKSGDLVHDINGRRIHNILQAIGAYIALRDESVLHVRISRKGEPMVLSYHLEERERRKDRKARRKAEKEAEAAAEAAAATVVPALTAAE